MRHLFFCAPLVAALLTPAAALAANHDPAVIIPLLAGSKVTLVEGIERSQQLHGPATSAKFEVGDDGKLVLSVYTIPEGFGVEPEKATLSEVTIDPTLVDGEPTLEVFADKEHIARAAVHMTLFQLSPLTLVDVLRRASHATGGTPIDVRNPKMADKRPIAEVVLFDRKFQVTTVRVDLLSGRVRRVK